MGESTQTSTTQSSSNPFQTALGAAGIIGGFGTAGGGTLGGDLIGGLFGGGVSEADLTGFAPIQAVRR